MSSGNLKLLLNSRKIYDDTLPSHTGLGNDDIGSYLFTTDEEIEVLHKCILNAKKQPSITEQIQDKDLKAIKKVFIDLDFKQESEARIITNIDITNLMNMYASIIFSNSDVRKITVYAQQRAEPYKATYKDKELYKDGLHFIIPDFQ